MTCFSTTLISSTQQTIDILDKDPLAIKCVMFCKKITLFAKEVVQDDQRQIVRRPSTYQAIEEATSYNV